METMSGNATTTDDSQPSKVAKKLDDLFVTAVEQFREWLKSPGHPSKAFEVFRNIIWSLQFATKARSNLLMVLWYDLMDLMRATHNHRIREWTYEILIEFSSMRHHLEIVRDNGGLCALREEYCREVGDFSMVSSGARVAVLTMLVRLTLYICHRVPELSRPILLDPKIFSMIETVVFTDVLPKPFRTMVWQRYLSVSRFAEVQQTKLQPLRVQQLRNPHQYNSMLRQQQQQLRIQQQQIFMNGLENASSGRPEAVPQTSVLDANEQEVLKQIHQQPFSQVFMDQQTSVSQTRFAEEQREKRLNEAQTRFWRGEQVQTVPPNRQAQHLEQSQLSQLQAQRLQEAYRQEMLERSVREQQQRQQQLQAQRSKTPLERLSQLAQHEVSRVDEGGQAYPSQEQVDKTKLVELELEELLLQVFLQRSQTNSQQNGSDATSSEERHNVETQRPSVQASYQQETHQQESLAPSQSYQDFRNLESRTSLQPQRPAMASSQQYQQNMTSYKPQSQLSAAPQWPRNVPPQANLSYGMPSSLQARPPGLSRGGEPLPVQNQVMRPMVSGYGSQRPYPTHQGAEFRQYLPRNTQELAYQQHMQQQRWLLINQERRLQLQRAQAAQEYQGLQERKRLWPQEAQALNQTTLASTIAGVQALTLSSAESLQTRQHSQIDQQHPVAQLGIEKSREDPQSDSKSDSQSDLPGVLQDIHQSRRSKQPELWQLPCEDLLRLQMEEGYLELPDDNEPEDI